MSWVDRPTGSLTIMLNFSFLVTYWNQPKLLEICLHSIRKYYPESPIIISQQDYDEDVDVGKAKLIKHNMGEVQWAGVARGLMEACDTDYGVFIEHDAFLAKPIDGILAKMNEYDLIGPEEVIPFPKLDRYAPGMVCQNFFVVNIKKMKEIGLDNIRIKNPGMLEQEGYRNVESGYGISQSLSKKLLLPVVQSGYAYGTYYGNKEIHHMWYGSYRSRSVEQDGVNKDFMENETKRLVEDYWQGKI